MLSTNQLHNIKGDTHQRRHDTMQEAFYTGWIQVHGLKAEEVYLSNRISTVYFPVSCRHLDIVRGPSLQDTDGANVFICCA